MSTLKAPNSPKYAIVFGTIVHSGSWLGGSVQIFKTKWLARFARREDIADRSLREAIERAERGLIDADLGGGLIKQRVSRKGQGRSGGYRMIVGYRVKNRAVFLLGFAKSERENIQDDEFFTLRSQAEGWLMADAATIQAALEDGALQEIKDDEES